MGTPARVVVLPRDPAPMRIEDVELPDPRGHQVVVRQFASGICHSQLHTIHGLRRTDVVLGHEATGEVLAVGDEVTNVAPGDRVLLTFQPRNLRETDRMPWMADVALADGPRARSSNIFGWYRDGDLDLDALVTTRVGLDEINAATQALDDGKVLGRTVIEQVG